MTALLLVMLIPAPLQAQLSEDTRSSTRGRQFIGPRQTPEQPAQPPPPAESPVEAAVQPEPPAPPPPAVPDAPPPRFPSVVFLVDTSDSMLNRSTDRTTTRLKEAKAALTQVLREMSPETRVQIWTFNTEMKPVLVRGIARGRFIPIGQGEFRPLLIEKVQGLRTAGGTNLFRSVVRALRFFDHPRDLPLYRSGQRFPVLVVVSDGEDGGKTRENMKTVKDEKKRRPLVTVNAIGFALGAERGWFEALCRIATRPEGCATADDGPQLKRILKSFYRPTQAR